MPPNKKGSKPKTGEPENTVAMDARVERAERELERMRVVMEEIQFQAVQNKLELETMHKEATISR